MQEFKERLLKSISSLSPRQQRELITFAELLCQGKFKKHEIEEIETDFFGIWAGRPEMQDSSKWVENLRKKEWNIN